MNRKMIISFFLGTAVSALALYFAFRNVPFSDLAGYIKTIHYGYLIPAFFIYALSYCVKVARWQIIVSEVKPISFVKAYHPLMIAFMVNCILPGRIGELARPVILKTKEKISLVSGIATVLTERIFDSVTLLILLSIVFYHIDINPSVNIQFAGYRLDASTIETAARKMIYLSAIIIPGIFLLTIDRTRKHINILLKTLPKRFFFFSAHMQKKMERISESLVIFTDNVAKGLSLIKRPLKLAACLFFSVMIWGLTALFYYFFSLGCPGIQLTLWQLSAFMIIICMVIALPSVPGYWGLWEAGGVFALSLFGVLPKEAAGFTLTTHAIQIFPVIIAGLLSAAMTSVNIFQISSKER